MITIMARTVSCCEFCNEGAGATASLSSTTGPKGDGGARVESEKETGEAVDETKSDAVGGVKDLELRRNGDETGVLICMSEASCDGAKLKAKEPMEAICEGVCSTERV